jgi:uncharacterized membrane protein
MTLETIVAYLMSALALAAVWAAVRVGGRSSAGRRAAPGYWLFAVGAMVQAWTLFGEASRDTYNTTLATLATVLLVAGLVVIARGWSTRRAIR